MAGYLDAMVAFHRRRAADAAAAVDLDKLALEAEMASPSRGFAVALRAPGASIIAELKRRSPSKGALASRLDPVAVASAYEAGGASCLSVLTDEHYFGGSLDDLVMARAASSLPVLRKDFTVCEADVFEARRAGADAVLLIVAALSGAELLRFRKLAESLGMDALVEVHDASELEIALGCGSSLVGVNQRDLHTFDVDTDRASDLVGRMPARIVKVAESGIRSRSDVERLERAGFDAMLVGERLVTAADPTAELRALLGTTAPEGGA